MLGSINPDDLDDTDVVDSDGLPAGCPGDTGGTSLMCDNCDSLVSLSVDPPLLPDAVFPVSEECTKKKASTAGCNSNKLALAIW